MEEIQREIKLKQIDAATETDLQNETPAKSKRKDL